MSVNAPPRPTLLDELPERIPLRLTTEIMDEARPSSNYTCFIGLALQRQHRLRGQGPHLADYSVGIDFVHVFPQGLGTVVEYRIPDEEAHLIEVVMDGQPAARKEARLALAGRSFDLTKIGL